MNISQLNSRTSAILAAIVAGAIGAGCASEPKHKVPHTRDDTTSETGMSEPVAEEQLEPAIQKAAEYLSVELPKTDAVKQSKNQLVLALPPSLEHDASIPDGRLQSAIQSLRNRLMQSEGITNNFAIINSTEMQSESTLKQIQSDNSAFRDPLQRTADNTHAAKYDPASIYLLSGKFYQTTDRAAGRREYHLFFKIENPQSRQLLLQKEVDIRLKWDSSKGRWVQGA